MNPAISIIIPNYNGAHLLQRNLPSVIAAAKYLDTDTRVIVVDDGSTDTSLNVLQQFRELTVLKHGQNRGFAEAVLTGVQAAESELVFLLNSDVQPEVSVLEPLVVYFSKPDTFAVAPLILDENGNVNRHSWNLRNLHHGNLRAREWTQAVALAEVRRKPLPTTYCSGGSVLVNRKLFLQLGGFCPLFKPFYGEDYDLGLRAWRMGFASYFEPSVSVLHQSQGSIKDNVKRSYVKQIRRRNRYLLEWLHIPVWRLWLQVLPLSVWRLLGELILLDKVNLKGFKDAVLKLPELMQHRRALDHAAQLTLDQVLARINHVPDESVHKQ